MDGDSSAAQQALFAVSGAGLEDIRQTEVGIIEYVASSDLKFSGILKKRYTDFLVNEILPTGQVVHLSDLKSIPKSKVPVTLSDVASSPAPRKSSVENEKNSTTGPPSPAANHENPESIDKINDPNSAVTANVADTGHIIQASSFKLSSKDESELSSYFDEKAISDILALHQEILSLPDASRKRFSTVKTAVLSDRSIRTKMHSSMRRIFSSRLETSTDSDGAILVSCAPKKGQGASSYSRSDRDRPRQTTKRPGWKERGGEYLHFSLFKENKDTMEVVAFLARELGSNSRNFQFAGTKDRRGVTVQRVSAYRIFDDRLAAVNRSLRGSKVGNFEYQPRGLALGELMGNEFVITLKDCRFPGTEGLELSDTVQRASVILAQATKRLKEDGFLNYFGLQRFGTFSAKTHTVGLKMLQEDLQAACQDILSYSPEALAAAKDPLSAVNGSLISSDDKARAYALDLFNTTKKANPALQELPRKYSAESALIRHLGGNDRANDFQGALQSIPRNLRLMYVHAYQSFVWNMVASERWVRFGRQVVEGDLVLVNRGRDLEQVAVDDAEDIDESGESIVHPTGEEHAGKVEDQFQRARPLTKEEVASGHFTIFDVVLPTPGFDVVYPANSLKDYYVDFMQSELGGRLDPFNMRRKWRDVSLSGNYRKLLARPLGNDEIHYELKTYSSDNEQLVETDLEKMQKKKQQPHLKDNWKKWIDENADKGGTGNAATNNGVEAPPPSRIAVILRLQLGTSQYATMALRELLGPGGVQTYKPDFGGGR
ncbi:MAG: hypothetical protein M1825_004686 [Sarcosagium campestre]|nr:MAG: hypothetical protein M1825_004686 [Sarcosagium campestre]